MPTVGDAADWLVKRISALVRTADSTDLTDGEYMAVDKSDGYTRKITVANLATWVFGKIRSLSTTITAFRTGDYIAVDGTNGTAKMSKDDLLKETAEKAYDYIHPQIVSLQSKLIEATPQLGVIDCDDLEGTIRYVESGYYHLRITSGFSDGDTLLITYKLPEGPQYGIAFWSDTECLYKYFVANEEGEDKPFVVPEGTTEIRINGTIADPPYAKRVTKILNVQEIGDIAQKFDDADKVPLDFKEMIASVGSGVIDCTDVPGTIRYTTSGYAYLRITSGFSAGDTILITYKCATGAQYGIAFWSATEKLLGYFKANEEGVNKPFIVPEGTTEIRVNGSYRFLPSARISHSTTSFNYFDIKESLGSRDNLFFLNNAFKRIFDLQKPVDFTWKITQPTITFIFDDALDDIEQVANLFASKNIPCCFSVIPQRLNDVLASTKTKKEVLLTAQENGCEILDHGSLTITDTSTMSRIEQLFVQNKQILVENGFNVDGIITVGGNDWQTFDITKFENLLRGLYSYNDAYGINLGLPQYYFNNRWWMTSNLSTNKEKVDDVVANTKWLSFSAHGVDTDIVANGIGLQVLEDTLDYAIAQGVNIETIRTMYNNSL